MSAAAGGGPRSFHAAYTSALADYLHAPTEAALRVAYELGREAVGRELSVLDLAVAHQHALSSMLADPSGAPAPQQVTAAAGDFFLESLSSFEMVQRGFKEARQALLDERRHTELSRQLSTFLADVSLALDASDSLTEMLQLVAEQARELVGAECCVASFAVDGHPRTAQGVSHSEGDRRWRPFVRWLDLVAIYKFLRLGRGSTRIAGEELVRIDLFRAVSSPPIHGWMAESLTALDGSELGAIQLYNKADGDFTPDDQAALVHLSQMASAAIERASLYHKRR